MASILAWMGMRMRMPMRGNMSMIRMWKNTRMKMKMKMRTMRTANLIGIRILLEEGSLLGLLPPGLGWRMRCQVAR